MKKLISIFLMTVMCLFVTDTLTGLKANAADQAEQSGIAVSVSSDKDDYAAAEDAQISFSIRNTNDTDLDGVNWELQLPDGLAAKNGSLSGENLRIRAGESHEGSVSVEIASPDTTEAVTDTAGTASADGTTTAPAVKAGEQKSAIGIFGLIAAAAALMWIARKRSRKLFGVLSVFFCAGLVAFSAPVRIFAADEESISVQAEKTLKFDGTNYTIKLSVTADAPQETAEPSDFYAWAEYSKDNSSITVKWQAQEDVSGYKVYDKNAPEMPLAEVKDGTEYVYAISESDAKAKYVFYVEAETADGEQTVSNDVTLRRNSDGSYTFSDIDSDRDGLDDLEEISRKTDRLNPDTDGDGLKDGYEVNQGSTDPLTADTDENGTPDGAEDFDGDGIPTQQENRYRANPYSGDTDEDGFPDSYEIMNGMNPANADPIVIDDEKAASLTDYSVTDLEAFNENEEYPLEIYYNEDNYIEQINGVFATEKIQNAQDALYALYHIKSLLGMNDPASELTYIKTVFTQWTVTYSFGMQHRGIEVEGRSVIITCKKDGKISSLVSGYLNSDHFKKLNLKPTVTKQQLRKIVNSGSDEPVEILSSDLCVRMDPEAVLTYRVMTDAQKAFWIDAHTGKIVYDTDIMSSWATVTATDETQTDRSLAVKYETNGYCDSYYLYHEIYKTAVYRYSSNDDMPGIADSFNTRCPDIIKPDGYKSYYQYALRNGASTQAFPEPGDWDGQAVSAYHNIIRTRERYASKGYYGLNGTGGATPVYIRANERFDPPDKANSQYSPLTSEHLFEAILFTDKCERSTSYTNNLDVFGHEFGHAVVSHHNGNGCLLLTSFFARMADEAYADIFGSWVQGKWMKDPRDIADPNSTENPAVMGDDFYGSSSDVHHNSTIISHAAYLLNQKYGYTMDEVFDVFYVSVGSLSDSLTLYEDICRIVVKAARDIGYPDEKVLKIYDAFAEVGVVCPTSSAKIIVKEGSQLLENVPVTISNYGTTRTEYTDKNGAVVFQDLRVGTYQAQIAVPGSASVNTTILVVENKQTERTVEVLSASTNYDWKCYDHKYIKQVYGPTLPKHIEINGYDIKMRGYTEVNYKDFLLTHENDDPDSFVHGSGKILTFCIDRDDTNWHTMEGGGFLFDVTVSDTGGSTDSDDPEAGSEGFLTAHCVLVTQQGLKIYYLENVDIALFRNGKLGYLGEIDEIGQKIGSYSYDIGDVTAFHSISINIRKGETETISVLNNGEVVVENLDVTKLEGNDYGPITSHRTHCCEQESWFTFSDILMSNVN